MTEAQRQTEHTISNAEQALAELLTIGMKLRLQLDILIGFADDHASGDPGEATDVIPTLTHLTQSVDALTEETTRLADEQKAQRAQLGMLGRRGVLLALAAVAVAVLLGGTLLGIQVANLARQQQQQQEEVLCPFFQLIVGSYDPDSRAAGPDRERYEAQFAVMTRIYRDVLACPDPPTPPRTDR